MNADGDLADSVDLATNYLPGYEGNVDKLWTGLSFRTGSQTDGQVMKLIVDGIGTGTSEISKIEFVLTSTTNLPGFASNHSSQYLPGSTENDYSFDIDTDRQQSAFPKVSKIRQAFSRSPHLVESSQARHPCRVRARDPVLAATGIDLATARWMGSVAGAWGRSARRFQSP